MLTNDGARPRNPEAFQAHPMPHEDITAAFTVLLRQSLGVSVGDELLIVYDESLMPFWEQFITAVIDNSCSATFVNLPMRYQETLRARSTGLSDVALPIGLSTALDEADVVATILDGDVALARVRGAIVNKAIGLKRPGNRLAHIPGLSLDVLEVLLRSPIAAIEEHCEAVAWALGEGRRLTLMTSDSRGSAYTLTCDLGTWLNEPLMSPGIIYRDSWGNVPPGETFCCPAPKSVSGTVAITGSIPDHVCEPNEDIVLDFDGGKLVDWRSESVVLRKFFATQQDIARHRGDNEWNTFAELGIGLNPAVVNLTGNSLFDEKAMGTVHIAIGDNFAFGHTVKSHIHADLVIRRPSLIVDGRVIIDAGELKTDAIATWREGLTPRPADLANLAQLRFRAETFESTPRNDRRFARRLHSRGRTGYVTIAQDKDALTLRRLCGVIKGDEWHSSVGLPQFWQQLGVDDATAARLLGLLVHYYMLYADPDPLTASNHAHV